MELKHSIKAGASANLSISRPRQRRRPEDADKIDKNWDATFGTTCPKCGVRHRDADCAKES
jgi:hypothetical protein